MQDADDMVTRLAQIGVELAENRRRLSDLAAERQRLLVELHDVVGWSDGKIAQSLGVSRAAVQKARVGR